MAENLAYSALSKDKLDEFEMEERKRKIEELKVFLIDARRQIREAKKAGVADKIKAAKAYRDRVKAKLKEITLDNE